MQVFYSINDFAKTEYETSLALGFFDGVHKGHKALIEDAVKEKGDLKSTVLTFVKSPVFSFNNTVSLLSTNEEKIRLFEDLKVDCVIFADFDKLINIKAEAFFNDILIKKLRARKIYSGTNYTFGKDREGNTDFLADLSKKNNIQYSCKELLKLSGENISSTNIRKYIESGDIKRANQMLGYSYAFTSLVVDGDKRGRTLNLPTINQLLDKTKVIPKKGVYKTIVSFDGKEYVGATDIGIHPTFSESSTHLETHILDFNNYDLYNKNISISFIDFIREEKKFENKDQLINQIKTDIEKIKGSASN